MDLNERQSSVAELIATTERILDALRNAESCETEEDFASNLKDAKKEVRDLVREIDEAAS